MRFKGSVRRAVAIATAAACIAAVVPVSLGGSAVVGAAGECNLGQLAAGGEYHALTPTRILDSRSGINTRRGGAATTSVDSDESTTFDIKALGLGGIPANPDDVLAVVLNVTVISPSAGGWMAVYPKGFDIGGGRNLSSLINFKTNGVVPNVAVVSVGSGGSLTGKVVTPGVSGSAHVAVDVFGWVSKSSYSGAEAVPA